MQRTPVISGFPFGIDFQKSLILLLTKDAGFASAVIPYLVPEYFDGDVLQWMYRYILKHKEAYNAIPTLNVLLEEARGLGPELREIYQLTIEGVIFSDLSQVEWLRDKVIDFIKRNIFVDAYKVSKDQYNTGSITEAYDTMMKAIDKLNNTNWEPVDREWFFDEFSQRTATRLSSNSDLDTIPTGINELDKILGGGLDLGEMGIWVAFAKQGKTTLLINHGAQAVRRAFKNVCHMVFEGTRKLVANRYDSVFAQLEYQLVKRGKINEKAYQAMIHEYQMYTGKLVIRAFVERWDYTVEDIHLELKELERLYHWVPDLLIIDYGDLVRGRGKSGNSETENQRAAFRDLKTLASRGYAMWTAAQGQRPTKDVGTDNTPLTSRSVADCYDKVRVADFIGSINRTIEEKERKRARLFAEMYRDNESGVLIPVYADFATMTIQTLRGDQPVQNVIHLGYNQGQPFVQTKAPIK